MKIQVDMVTKAASAVPTQEEMMKRWVPEFEEMMKQWVPEFEANPVVYEKFKSVYARHAMPGEVIETYTADGKETTRIAGKYDMVVKNDTTTENIYIIPDEDFDARYSCITGQSSPPWRKYAPTGKILGIEYQGPEMKFIAAWGEEMVIKPGDMLALMLPKKNEIYRIAAKEFSETYRLAGAP